VLVAARFFMTGIAGGKWLHDGILASDRYPTELGLRKKEQK